MQRYGSSIKLKPEKYAEYKQLHANICQVAAIIEACNIRNYSIYHWDGLLFSYFEYIGDDFATDMAKMAQDPQTHAWWALTDPCQEPLTGNSTGSLQGNWWTRMEELFHQN